MNLRLFILIALALTACRRSYSPKEYSQWMSSADNELVTENNTYGIEYKCQVLPPSWLALKEVSILESDASDSAFESLIQEYAKGTHFQLQLRPNQQLATSKEFYQANQSYLDFGITKDLSLVSEGDTIPCVHAILDRSIGLKPHLTYQLSFDKQLPQKEFSLNYMGLLTSDSLIEFRYNHLDPSSFPELKR